jgi:hypothetical protein
MGLILKAYQTFNRHWEGFEQVAYDTGAYEIGKQTNQYAVIRARLHARWEMP